MAIREFLCIDCGSGFMAARSDALRCRTCSNRRKSQAFELRRNNKCQVCGKFVTRRAPLCLSCRARTRKGENSNGWRGGRIVGKDGYARLRTERPDRRTPYELEHRVLWERAFGPLPKWHIIHHLNGIKSDNRLENLAAMSRADHHTKHAEPYEARIRALEARVRELEGAM